MLNRSTLEDTPHISTCKQTSQYQQNIKIENNLHNFSEAPVICFGHFLGVLGVNEGVRVGHTNIDRIKRVHLSEMHILSGAEGI